MFDLEMTEDQRLVRETVASFARDEIRPISRDCDESGHIPPALADKGFDLGLIHSAIPEDVGGYGEMRSAVTGAIVTEELGWGDLSIALHLLAPRLLAYPVVDAGTPEQKARLSKLNAETMTATTLAGDPVTSILTHAPANHAAIGGVKVNTANGWFAARPSGTENIYKIYAESFQGQEHLDAIVAQAQEIVTAAVS